MKDGKQTRKGPPDHELSVRWSGQNARFDVCRDGLTTSSHAKDRRTAVDVAIREARQEAMLTGCRIIVTSMLNGKKIIELDGREKVGGGVQSGGVPSWPGGTVMD